MYFDWLEEFHVDILALDFEILFADNIEVICYSIVIIYGVLFEKFLMYQYTYMTTKCDNSATSHFAVFLLEGLIRS